MVAEAIHLGYNYYAICDHSHRLRNGLLEQQGQKAIDRLADPEVPIRLLKGVEVNIRVNGEVDMPESDLAGLDWVSRLARAARSKRIRAGRVLAAMENPYVDCIGHLTGRRRSGRREPAAIDLERSDRRRSKRARSSRSTPSRNRLDLSDVGHARGPPAKAGLKLVIDSDAHQTAALHYPELGGRPGLAGPGLRRRTSSARTPGSRSEGCGSRGREMSRLRGGCG